MTKMEEHSLTQPLLRDQAKKPPRLNCAQVEGMDLKCGGAACPWMTKDTEDRSKDMKKLSRAVIFCVLFMLVEVVGGIKAGSLAILTDAAHLLSDVASFAISLFAMWAGGWEANLRQTYGFFRLEILGALVSIQIIWLITGIIVYEAFVRLFRAPVGIDGRLMFLIASLGLVVNLVMMFILDHGHGHGPGHGHSHGSGHGHSHGSGHGHSHGSGHGHSHGSSDGHSHSHGSSHGHKHNEDRHHHDKNSPNELYHHPHGDEDSHDHHGDEHGHDQHEDDQSHDHHDHGHEHQEEAAPLLEHHNDRQGIRTSSGNRMDQTAALILSQNGHKTECVRKNITKSPRSSGDTIIMCICDEVERQPETDRSVRVTIDHGGENEVSNSTGGSINVRGAYLHVLGDFIQSIGVMVGGAIIWYKPEWQIVDLICTFFFSILVLWTTINMIRDILEVLMESTPREVDAGALQQGLMEIEGVIAVHELHIWAITVGKVVLACHVMIEPDADSDDLLQEVVQYCDKKYKISHVTVQIERFRQ